MNDTTLWKRAECFRDAHIEAKQRINTAQTITEAMVHANEAMTWLDFTERAVRATVATSRLAEEIWR